MKQGCRAAGRQRPAISGCRHPGSQRAVMQGDFGTPALALGRPERAAGLVEPPPRQRAAGSGPREPLQRPFNPAAPPDPGPDPCPVPPHLAPPPPPCSRRPPGPRRSRQRPLAGAAAARARARGHADGRTDRGTEGQRDRRTDRAPPEPSKPRP